MEIKIKLGTERNEALTLLQCYGQEDNPTIKSLLKQLGIVAVAYPNLGIDTMDFLQGMTNGEELATMTEAAFQIDKLASLIYLHEAHDDAAPRADLDLFLDLSGEESEYDKLNVSTTMELKVLFDHSTYRCSYATSPKVVATMEGTINFSPVDDLKEIQKNIGNLALLLTTTASPSTLSLFAHKGPSLLTGGLSTEEKGRVPFCLHYWSQPQWNSRQSVERERVDEILDTCAGQTDYSMVAHGVTAMPYGIETSTVKEQARNVAAPPPRNAVDISYPTDQCCQQGLIGKPVAVPLETGAVFQLWTSLMGSAVELESVIKFAPAAAEVFGKLKDQHQAQFWLSVLIQRLDQEYSGFRSIRQWKKLYWRLTKVYGEDDLGALVSPKTEQNLIYTTMILFQGLSKVRLCFLEGQGRHFTAVHALLGLHPILGQNLKHPHWHAMSLELQPAVHEIVGMQNNSVDLVDFGLKGDAAKGISAMEQSKFRKLMKFYSKLVQTRAEALSRTNVISLMMTFLDLLNGKNGQYLRKHYAHPEMNTKALERKKDWYKTATMDAHTTAMAKTAIDFLVEEVKDEKGNPMQSVMNDYFDKVAKTAIDTVEERKDALREILTTNFGGGVLYRSNNIPAPHASVLVILLSQSFVWSNSNRCANMMTKELKLFIQEGASGRMQYTPRSKYLFIRSGSPYQYPVKFPEDDKVSDLNWSVLNPSVLKLVVFVDCFRVYWLYIVRALTRYSQQTRNLFVSGFIGWIS